MFTFTSLAIPDVKIITPKQFPDSRGSFSVTYIDTEFSKAGLSERFVQDNVSVSNQYVLRGLHSQEAPHPQAKLVQVISGEIFDVVVDIRPLSPTYGHWVASYLNDKNRQALFIPKGFAHGFFVCSESAIVHYRCDDYFHPELEKSIHWNDPDLGIEWPIPRNVIPIVSEKDAASPRFK